MFCAVPPTFAAPSCVPFQDASLNDLSSSVPTSVTIPILRALGAGLPPLPGLHAAPTIATTASSNIPSERLRMDPPPGVELIASRPKIGARARQYDRR